jgi:proline iminopeptidase/L-proline amide hydrolase
MADAARLRRQLPAETRDRLTACDASPPPEVDVCDAATKAYYGAYVRRSTVRNPLLADYASRQPQQAGRVLYEKMWGKSEFAASGVLKDYDGESLLTKLNGPRTLFVCGEYDEATPTTVAGFARRVPGSTFRKVKGSAHAILADEPAVFLELISTWCSRFDPSVWTRAAGTGAS